MYQALYSAHYYMPHNTTFMPGNDVPYDGRFFLGESLHQTEGSTNERHGAPSQPLLRQQGGRKSNYWVSRRTLRGAQASSPYSGIFQNDSEDSTIPANNHHSLKAKRVHEHVTMKLDYDRSQCLASEEAGRWQQPGLLFHNKRRRAPRAPLGPLPWRHGPPPFYTPLTIAPDRFLMRSHLVQVVDDPPSLKSGSKWNTLSLDIWNKFLCSQQTEETYKKKITLWRYLFVTIKNMFPRYSIYMVGSTISGFSANNSDVDLCLLVNSQESYDNRILALNHLEIVSKLIKSMDKFSNAMLIRAKVPILKFKDNWLSLEVDLNCNNVVGIRNTHLLYCYSQLDKRVRPLVLIVKIWAQHHDINDAKNRTISSYSLVLMVIHFLQCGTTPAVLPCLQADNPSKFSSDLDIHQIDLLEQVPRYNTKNTQTLGELLYGFLKYYTEFDYDHYAVSVRTGKLLSVRECRAARSNEPHQWKFLCVEEPFNLSNTARSVYDADVFSHIRGVFKKTTEALKSSPSLLSLLPSQRG